MIDWEQCKSLKFGHADKWYMHKPESVLENEMHKILWDFVVIYKTFCLDEAQGCMNGAPNEKWTGTLWYKTITQLWTSYELRRKEQIT